MANPLIRLVTRGDDAGSCNGANAAIVEACDRGILRNVSIMVPGPAFEAAARLLAGRTDLCLGLHVTLNAEWVEPRWGPVLPASRVPSLVDVDGCFLPTPQELNQRGCNDDQAMAEIEAQLRRARDAGLAIAYLDEHMGVSWMGNLRQRLADLARREGLIETRGFAWLPPAPAPREDWLENLEERFAATAPGTYVLVTHPGVIDTVMSKFRLAGQPAGIVARQRDAERRGLIDKRLSEICRVRRVLPISYREAV